MLVMYVYPEQYMCNDVHIEMQPSGRNEMIGIKPSMIVSRIYNIYRYYLMSIWRYVVICCVVHSNQIGKGTHNGILCVLIKT